ncbi:MAG: diaminopimelate epimerase [Alphaproteobacteria bacterium]|nr:diaminopimelate epimerase [Alphaproteobacteria bacterium]NCQ66600.1 diaminopimelate epimerase [Alphaproteobacteria bacterium]NCT06952.1 diaminopimelate epimerase [Alphaproteobacteria bacterium]
MKHPFVKMHGLGNDFVILDHREEEFSLTPEKIQLLANRRFGIGCDQLIVLEPSFHPRADVFMRIYNPDGKEAGACGNATRCLGSLLSDEFKRPSCTVETVSGLLTTTKLSDDLIQVNMGEPRLAWQDIPLAKECDTLHLPIQRGVLSDPVAVSMGNPHMVFFVRDVQGIDVYNLGKQLTAHELYPEQANVEFVEVIDRETLRVRVYERGTGVTMACGTGASAAVVAATHRGLIDNHATVILDGGKLDIVYEKTVMITGPVGYAFEGSFTNRLFESSCQTQPTPQTPPLQRTAL